MNSRPSFSAHLNALWNKLALKLKGTVKRRQGRSRRSPVCAMESLEERRLLSALAIGDIAFTGYQATAPDKVSFVLLADISGTTTVTVTDNAWTGAALAASEGNSVVTLTGNFTAGTQFNYDATRTAGLKWAVGTTTTGITDVTGANFSLNASGDNLVAYNGSSAPTTGNSALWIAGFASNAFLTTGTQTASLTYLPSALTAGDTALSLGIANATANENGALTGPSSISGTPAAIRAVVNTLANWTTFTAAGAQAIPPNISFTIGAANTSPTISTNTGLTLDEAATAAIDSTKLAATDTEQGAASLTFTIGTAATHGAVKKSGTTLLAGGTFTQADIDSGLITYEHDGSETTSDSFTFTVTDGAGGSSALTTFNITVTALNDAPTLTTNTGLSGVVLGTTTTISNGNLLVSDADNAAAQLTYTLGTEPAGLLKLSGTTLTSGGTFTQADINAGLVTYTAPASGTTDSFTFTLSDGAGGTIGSTTVSITLTSGNTSPTVAVNTGLPLNEGATATIANANLQVTDSEQGAVSLTYTLDAVPGRGLLKKSGTTLNVNDTFTQADIDGGLITYVHDGSETTSDSFSFLISDGAGGTVGSTTFAFTVTPVNDSPVLTTNAGLTVLEGAAATVISNSLLSVSDVDNTAGQIVYTLTTIPAGGTLAKSGLALAISDTFTQADVDAGLITYAHAGGESPSDSFQFTVSDGAGGTIAATSFAITVTAVNDAPANTINRTLTLNPGQVVAISNAILLATDVDTGTGSLNYSVTSGPTRGTITKNGVAVTAFTQNDLNAGDTAAASIRYAATTAVAGDTDAITLSLSDGTTTVTVTLNISIVAATAPASFTGSYSQNFDNLLPTPVPGNNSSLPGAMVLPQGWLASETGTNSNNSVRIDAGFQATGDAYFYGALGSNERALGTQASGSNDPVRIGLTLTNDSGTTITSLNLSYIGEQWRKGTSTVDKLSFSYSTSASSLTTGTYTAVTALDFTPPGGGTNDQVRDGNLVANQVNVSGTITGLTWAPGATLYLRWSDVNSTGNDDGMAVDTVSITTANSLPAQAVNTGLSLGVGATEEITTAKLQHTDAEQAASALTYTLTNVPVSGQLKLNGTTLVANDTFTQADIDNHLLTFTSAQAGLLSFGFTVSDGQGGVTAPATFQITSGTAASNVYINEVVFNPEAVTDTGEEYIELRGTPNTFVPTDVYLILLEGDSEDGSGSVDHIFNIGGMAFGSNGYLVLRQAGSTYTVASGANDVVATGSGWGTTFSSRDTDIENGAVSILIIQTASAPVADSDVDADDNGTLDGAAAAWTVRDAIGNIDGGASDTAYGSFNTSGNGNGLVPAGSTFINLSGYHPDYMGRNGDSTGYTAADWVVGELAGAIPNVTLATGGFTSPSTFEGAPLNHIGSSNAFSTTNTPPTITSGTAFSVAENTAAVTTVTATDPNAGDTLTYSISGGADAAKFSINASTGALSFLVAPNFESPTDTGANNVYDVQASVSDGVNAPVTQDIAVTVTNVNESPAITSGAAFNVAENTTAVTTVTATDPDARTTLTCSISGGADAAKFSINASTGALTFLAAPNFEAPADAGANNVYDVQVSVSDGSIAVTQDIAVTVASVNEAPVLTSVDAFNVPENTTAVTTVTATDPDVGTTLTFYIDGGVDAWMFTIDSVTGELTFNLPPNFEALGGDNEFQVYIGVGDGESPHVTQIVNITVTDVTESPTITSGAAFNVAENTTAVTTVTATDPDAGTTLTYSISGGADAALFSINSSTGALTFLAAPNLEAPADSGANNVYNVQVSVSDGSIAVTQDIAVTVTNVNETPAITSGAAFNVAENTTAVTTVTATDPDAGATLTYAISGGADAALFSINATTGALTFLAAPDFEAPADAGTNNVYDVQVSFSDGVNTAVTQDIAVTVTNVNEAPVITSGNAFNVAENTTAVTTVTATDPDAGTTLSYSISGGADAAKFSINASTGALTFLAAPNFESPTDAGANNVYDVQVSVSDGTIAVTQDIAVTVTNVNEAPVITSGNAFNVAENTTAVTTVVATDPDAGTSLTYSISGGADATLFSINASTGALRFVAAPDFETPTDAGSNNVYDVQVSVSDGTNPAVTRDIAVTVTNVDETTGLTYSLTSGVLSVVGTSGDDIITVFNDAGAIKIDNNGSIIDTGATAAAVTGVSISGLGGNDTLKIDLSLGAAVLGSLLGGDGNDLLISGRGNDLLDGGNDTDEASFIQAASGVNVYLATTGPQNTAGAGTDRLVQVENLTGSNFNDNLFGNAGVNQLFGGAGNDNLDGLGGADALDGGIGNDTLTFDALDTSVVGGADNDRAFVSGSAAVSLNMVTGQIEVAYATSSAANNTFDASGAAFAVTVIGGSGNDTILGGNANDNLSGGAGADSLGGGSGNDTLDGGTGADALDAGAGADTLYFDNLDTSVVGGADADRSFLTAGTGPVNYNLATGQMEIVYAQSSTFNNVFDATGAAFGVSIYGGGGNDTITGGTQNDVLSGGGGNDSLTGNAGNDSLDGGTGADSLDGGIGADTLTFDNFDVSVIGGADVDRAFISGATTGVNYNLATGLMEIIYAQSSTQPNTFDATGATFQVFIYGGSGNDTIIGGDQNDVLSGGGGNDTLIGNLGNDNIDGGIGIDTVSYVTAGSSVNVNLATFRATGGAGIDSLFNLENVIGSNFDDVINGNALDNILDGGAGLDIITGGGGTDTIL
jgi:VCBS repeat-containing protein